jgi:hypothetical protein
MDSASHGFQQADVLDPAIGEVDLAPERDLATLPLYSVPVASTDRVIVRLASGTITPYP